MNNFIFIIIMSMALQGVPVIADPQPEIGRYTIVETDYSNRLILLDTVTGKTWNHMAGKNSEWMEMNTINYEEVKNQRELDARYGPPDDYADIPDYRNRSGLLCNDVVIEGDWMPIN